MEETYGGCLGKVESGQLLSLIAKCRPETTNVTSFADYELVEIPSAPHTRSLCTSTDLVYDVGLGSRVFGELAVVHALSDIYAALSDPFVATFVMGVPHGDDSEARASEALAGLLEALRDNGVAFGGAHTVHSSGFFIAVSPTGLYPEGLEFRLQPGETYKIVLSKPLGSGLYLAAARNRLLPTEYKAELVRVLLETNRTAADSLRHLRSTSPDSIGWVTDVSGFGLGQALRNKVPYGWQVRLEVDRIPRLEMAVDLIRAHGLSTRLGDANLLQINDDDQCNLDNADIVARVILADPQTSGGLLAAVHTDVCESLLALHRGWTVIGQLSDGFSPEDGRVHVLRENG